MTINPSKTLILPKQIALCNQHFSPQEAQLLEAREIIELWAAMDSKKQ